MNKTQSMKTKGSVQQSGVKGKRTQTDALKLILKWDAYITDVIVRVISKYLPLRTFKKYYKGLEYSCHGVVWLASWLAMLWILWQPSLFQMQVNFFIGLITDIIFIALIKSFVRRKRPAANQPDTFTIGPDKYSFPSGHVSRAVYISLFFIHLYPLPTIFWMPLLSWASGVAASRILLHRHYLLDVLGGAGVGLVNSLLVYILWVGPDTASWLVRWISEERIDGELDNS
ncbi:polyisoprenoid diphosphate/phosphate phosphohydrolase PLPP6 [Bemisia tabaci]